ncbi:MAG: hypothetical protein Q8P07_02320 [bacterium]|nr:hypothetical protein [bacterium]
MALIDELKKLAKKGDKERASEWKNSLKENKKAERDSRKAVLKEAHTIYSKMITEIISSAKKVAQGGGEEMLVYLPKPHDVDGELNHYLFDCEAYGRKLCRLIKNHLKKEGLSVKGDYSPYENFPEITIFWGKKKKERDYDGHQGFTGM